MGLQLQADIAEGMEQVCPYAATCKLINGRPEIEAQDVSERYFSICVTDRKRDCSEYKLQEGKA